MKLSDSELTRLAAEKVMGWKIQRIYANDPSVSFHDCVLRKWTPDDSWRLSRADTSAEEYWSPLTDWRAAGEIVDEMRDSGWALILVQRNNTYCAVFVLVGLNVDYQVENDGYESAPRAITIAALFAVGAVTLEQV